VLDRFLYYVIVMPLSFMPLWYIYIITDFFYLIIYYVKPYRKKVVLNNMANAFPEKTEAERKAIAKKFYSFFTDLLAESTKNLTISEAKMKKRLKVRNPQLMEDLFKKGKSVIFLSSHFNNWEPLITAQNILFPHQAFGIGTPLSSKFWDKKINDRRERFGMRVTTAGNYKQALSEYKEMPSATLILGDQSPGKDENCYWTSFLNQETAFFFGAEAMANQMDMAVVYGSIYKIRRGYYEIEIRLITEDPADTSYGEITEGYIRILEEDIKGKPEAWLWSHKRWKKKVPDNLGNIKTEHKNRFNDRFRDG